MNDKPSGVVLNWSGGIDGYTNGNGYFVWGNPEVLAENARREQVGQEKAAREQAAFHVPTLDQEAQRAEPSPAESAARALWENATPAPAVEQDGPQIERERSR
jgi:hypothetical protein